MMKKYVDAKKLAELIGYSERYIRSEFKKRYLIEGVHFTRVGGGRRILFDVDAISKMLDQPKSVNPISIPMANGGVCNG